MLEGPDYQVLFLGPEIDKYRIENRESSMSTIPNLVWVSVFSCLGKDPILKPFYESIQHDNRPSADELTAIVRNSFEAVGFGVAKSVMAPNLTHCQVTVADRSDSCDLIVSIKTKPALQIGDKLFKLEEFEI